MTREEILAIIVNDMRKVSADWGAPPSMSGVEKITEYIQGLFDQAFASGDFPLPVTITVSVDWDTMVMRVSAALNETFPEDLEISVTYDAKEDIT